MDITLLTDEQIWGDDRGDGQLQVMKRYGTKVGMSDLAVLLGGAVSKSTFTTSEGQRSSYVWSASPDEDGDVRAVFDDGDRSCDYSRARICGSRPAVPPSASSSIRLSETKPSKTISGVDVVEYGEYPQTVADEAVTRELNGLSEFQLKKMETGKRYHFDSETSDAYEKPFSAKAHAEYRHKGKKYIRVEAKPYGEGCSTLSNGKTPHTGEIYWIQVQPVEWLIDPSGICVARQALFAGIRFDGNGRYDGNFADTDMNKYLQNYFVKEMLSGRDVSVPAAIGPNTAAVLSGREAQRREAANATSWPI